MRSPYGETVTVVEMTVTGQDSMGGDIYSSVSTDYDGCTVWPGTSGNNLTTRESGGLADQVSADYTVDLPAHAALPSPQAQLIVRGDKHEVVGRPEDYRNSRTGRRVLVVQCRRVTG